MPEAYIVAAVRTAGGRKGGKLAGWHPADLAAQVLDAVVARAGADPALVDDVILGCVVQIGEQAVNVARNAVLASSLPESVPATTIDRQCGSSQQALHFAAQAVMSGTMDVVIAGGVESMTRVPIGLSTALPAKNGFGSYKSPNMEERYPEVHFSQFIGAEMMARKYDLSRDELDAYSYDSHRKAIAATQAHWFDDEIVPVEIAPADGVPAQVHTVDEGIRFDASLDAIRSVKLLDPERPRDGGELEPDLRRRVGLPDRERARARGAGRRADRAHPSHERARARSGDHARSTDPRDAARAAQSRAHDRRHRRVRSERGVRTGAARVAAHDRRRSRQAQRARRRDRAGPPARGARARN